jgi:hypothetical protein
LIERRGKAVAELGAISKPAGKVKLPDTTRFWNDFPKAPSGSARYLEEDR